MARAKASVSAVGLGPLLARSETLLLVVKLVGAAYLIVIVLGVRAILLAVVTANQLRPPTAVPYLRGTGAAGGFNRRGPQP